MRKPNLFIAGVQKAGTTSLHDYLGQHPEIFMSKVKEPGYYLKHENDERFVSERVSCLQRERPFATDEEYFPLFEGSTEKWVGESTTGYFGSDLARTRIKAACPDARIILCLREPVGRAFSAFNWARKVGHENITKFEDALAQEDRRREQGMWFFYDYTGTSHYIPHVEAWMREFDNVRIVLFEDLVSKPEEVLRGIFEWLGVDPAIASEVDTSKRNPSGIDANAATANLRRVVMKPRMSQGIVYRTARKLLGDKTLRKLKKTAIRTLDKRVEKPEPLARETAVELSKQYEQDIPRLEALTGLSLDRWRKR